MCCRCQFTCAICISVTRITSRNIQAPNRERPSEEETPGFAINAQQPALRPPEIGASSGAANELKDLITGSTPHFGRQASRLSWQTGFQPVTEPMQQPRRLFALTGQEACLPFWRAGKAAALPIIFIMSSLAAKAERASHSETISVLSFRADLPVRLGPRNLSL